MKEVNILLHEEAIKLGLCEKWSGEWKDSDDAQKLIDRYKKGFDFVIKHNWPSPEYIEGNFDRRMLHDNKIWCNEVVDNSSMKKNGTYIVNGNCRGSLSFDEYSASTVFVRHGSRIAITACGNAIVNVRLYDNASVFVTSDGMSRVRVIKNGDRCSVNATENVIITENSNAIR